MTCGIESSYVSHLTNSVNSLLNNPAGLRFFHSFDLTKTNDNTKTRAVMTRVRFLFDIELWRNIQFVRDIFPVFFALTNTFREQIFDLSVHGSEIILRPCGDCRIELWGKAQRHLLFLIIVHINTGCRN